ncbi:MAG: orotate phosphoribosyltransferase [Candidatus Theseobacter exili]|nr:orotate phosphoribosyltransferase [Candidatus Theseobacter exili]
MNNDIITGNSSFIEMFEKSGALLKGHFELSSGKHSGRYLQCALVLQYPEYARSMCKELASKFSDIEVDVVLGPALGGVVVSYETANAIGVRSIFCERKAGRMLLRRGFNISKGERVLIVEDVVTTGGSIIEAADLVRKEGGVICGYGMIVDRTGGSVELEPRKESLLRADFLTYNPDSCPLCEKRFVVDKPGSRR